MSRVVKMLATPRGTAAHAHSLTHQVDVHREEEYPDDVGADVGQHQVHVDAVPQAVQLAATHGRRRGEGG